MMAKINSRNAAVIGMVSAIIWLISLTVEYAFHLQPPGNGALLYSLDQVLFFIAMLGYVILLLGMWQAKAAGNGVFGNISLGIFIAGLVSLLIAQIVSTITHNPNFFLFPIGGMLQMLGGLLTGIAVVTARRWDRWQRFAPLLQGLYYLIVLILVLVIFNQPPTQLSESVWQITWFITSLALFTKSRDAAFGNETSVYQSGISHPNGD